MLGKIQTNNKTIVLGLEHFIDKIGYQSAEYLKRSKPVVYLVCDKSGYSKSKAEQYKANIVIVPKNQASRIFTTIHFFWKMRPKWCELYDTGRLTLFYALIAKLFNVKLITILRGQEFNRTGFRFLGLKMALKLSDAIVAKEHNLIEKLSLLNLSSSRINNLPNAIPLPKNHPSTVRDIDILFLNSVRKERNVDLLLDAIYELVQLMPNLNVAITGFSTLDESEQQVDPSYEKKILLKIQQMNLSNNVTPYGFVSNPEFFYLRSKIFVLPADVIFLNYSLLEAMSYKVAPVVCAGEGAKKIIEHELNGLIVNFDKELLANAIYKALKSNQYIVYGEQAYITVKQNYDIKSWADRMEKIHANVL